MNADLERLKQLPGRMSDLEIQVTELRRFMNNRFMALLYKINAMHMEMVARFDAMDKRFDAIDKRLDAHDADLAEIKRRI